MMKCRIIGLTVTLLLLGCGLADAQVMQVMMKLERGVFADCQFSAMAMWEDGEVIAAVSEDRKMTPASNQKVITTGAALCALGEQFVWDTRLAYSGSISNDGTLEGDLYIIGGGDPLLGSKVKGTPPIEHVFAEWGNLLRAAGIVKINGSVVGDGCRLEGMREDPSWQYGDLGTYYGTGLSALNFYENRQDFSATPGKVQGDPVNIFPTYPSTPWMKWDFLCTTGEKGSGDKLYLFTAEGTDKGTMRGSLGLDRGEKTVMCRNNFPEYTLANEFCNYLISKNISVTKGPAALPAQPPCAGAPFKKGEKLQHLGTTSSMPLAFVVKHTNKTSDNLCAEILFRSLGRKLSGSSDIEPSRKAVASVLKDSLKLDIAPSKIMIADGSGLSGQNFVSAKFMCRFLQKMLSTPHEEAFLASLNQSVNVRVRLKTGSFKGCRTLCGYVLPEDANGKKIIFSIMVNYSHLNMWTIDRNEKAIIAELIKLPATQP